MSPGRQPDDDRTERPALTAETPPAETSPAETSPAETSPAGTNDAEDPAALRAARRARRRAQRRERARRGLDTSVPSPCIQVCQVDPKNDCCIGCGRHIDEIRDWPILSAEEKTAILEKLPERFRKK
ncbi:DUF1289 domain-containing protein [Pelagibius sp.]|uniref:DUF1289 domain-containing protein n=1 Tax=Pelagibius sp. TaxID=1931238 RepID=UPI002631D36F|nr:DUF1289 domain-containing protein [Pelagibius sp.]